jgi:hypothetical protein
MKRRKFISTAGIIFFLFYANKITEGANIIVGETSLPDSLKTISDTTKEITAKIETELDNMGYLNFKSYQYPDGSKISSVVGINIREQLEEVNKKPFEEIAANPFLWKGVVGNAVVFIGQYGVFAVQLNKNIEASKPYFVIDEKVENYEVKPYPGKENWAIIIINGKPTMVLYTVKRGILEVPDIRAYNARKDG